MGQAQQCVRRVLFMHDASSSRPQSGSEATIVNSRGGGPVELHQSAACDSVPGEGACEAKGNRRPKPQRQRTKRSKEK